MGTQTGVAAVISSAFEGMTGAPLPVQIRAWDGSRAGPDDAPAAVLHSRRAGHHLLWSPGELGLARAYVSGDLDIDGDLREGLRRCWEVLGNRPGQVRPSAADWLRLAVPAVRLGLLGGRPRPPAQEARIRGRLHTPGRDRDAIAHHYDLGNEFYSLILDPRLVYSCAFWRGDEPGYDLEQAQLDKLDLICGKLDLRPGERLLDVGCGWGSLIIFAAEHYGVRATGITLSAEQRDHVAARIRDRGLDDLVDVRLQDYRTLAEEPYDAVASIEMGEHVGEQNYPLYLQTLRRMLKPGAPLVIQQMSRGPVAPGGGAFIESYIAPDMTMRPLDQTLEHLRGAGLEVRGVQVMGPHYVHTIDAWAARLEAHWDQVVDLVGVGWARVWRLYLAGGALSFEGGRTGVNQILATRPAAPDRNAEIVVESELG